MMARQQWRPPEPEARAQPDEVRPVGLAVSGRPQPEEGVMLHGALPQVLAGPGAVQAEHERVLLLPALGGEVRALVYAAAGNPDAGSLPRRGGTGARLTWSSSSTTTSVSLLFLKSILVIFGLAREKAC